MGQDAGLYKIPKISERDLVIDWDDEIQDTFKVEEITYWRKMYTIGRIIMEIIPFQPTYTAFVILTKEQLIQICDKLKVSQDCYAEEDQERYEAAIRTLTLVIEKVDHEEWTILYSQSE